VGTDRRGERDPEGEELLLVSFDLVCGGNGELPLLPPENTLFGKLPLWLLNTVLPPELNTRPDGATDVAYEVLGGGGGAGNTVATLDTGGSDDDETVCNNLAELIVLCA
jgi:hypothetical protein